MWTHEFDGKKQLIESESRHDRADSRADRRRRRGNLIADWIHARTTPAHVRVARKPAGGSWSASIEISPSPANAQSPTLSVRADGFTWAV